MQTKIRQIGSSKGIIIPSNILAQCKLSGIVNVSAKNNKIIISQHSKPLRAGWFEGYQAQQDTDVLDDMVALLSEDQDWQW